jgi:hypothetical protein
MNTRNLIRFTQVASVLLIASVARADFGYTMTRKGPAAGETKYFYKGQKMKTDSGNTATILDFDAQTITTVNNTQKSYSVKKFSDLGDAMAATGADVQADVKETGQHKTINGLDATQLLMTMQMEMPQAQGMKSQMDMEIWISADVPGGKDLRAFYQRNASKFPWAAMGEGSSPSMRAAMANLQKKLAGMNGVPVLEVIHVKMGGGGAAQASQAAAAAQSDPRMAAARAQLEQMAKQPGPAGDGARQALARMGGAPSAGGGGGIEITMEAGGFSSAPIPDSVFAIPAGYSQSGK